MLANQRQTKILEMLRKNGAVTAANLVETLKARFTRLTVITYSYDVFKRLCHHADFQVSLFHSVEPTHRGGV